MVLEFIPNTPGIPPNDRGKVQQWLEQNLDRDNDAYTAMVSSRPGDRLLMRYGWHTSSNDAQRHMLANIYLVSVAVYAVNYQS